jgi:hypothetical protein
LPDEQKVLRLQAYEEFVQSAYDNRSFLDSTVRSDETWYFQYDNPEQKEKRQSME